MSASASRGEKGWEELMSLFRAEAGERTRLLERGLAGDARPEDDGLDLLRREAHTLKGTAAVLGLDELSELAGAMEDRLRGGEDGVAGPDVEAVQRAAAAFREGADAVAEGEQAPASVAAALAELRSSEPGADG